MTSLPKTADAVVIGGGAMGCATAYYLKKSGVKDVVLLERDAILSGSTGRCAGGFRHQFPTIPECQFAKDSLSIIAQLQDELECDLEYNKGGYLVLAYTDEQIRVAKEQIEMQKKLGINVRWMETSEIAAMAPWLNADEGFRGAAWCPDDGMLNPFKLTLGYMHAFERMGGKVLPFTPVEDIKNDTPGHYTIQTPAGVIETEKIFNCTGAFSKKIGQMLGVDIPVIPLAREKIVTEPVKRMQPFLCHSPLHTFHFNQTKNGNFLMSCANMSIKQRTDLKNTWRFAQETAEAASRIVPSLGKARILRQWAGFYETTPDNKPLLGGIDGLDGYAQTVGYNGHGMMLAPAAGKVLVDYSLGKEVPEWFDHFDITRFS